MSQNKNSVALIDLGGSLHRGPEERAVSPFRRVGSQTLLERTVRRLSDCSWLDKIVIVGDSEFSGLVAQGAMQPAVWVPCDEASSVARAWHVAEQFDAQWIISVSGTNVFVDPILVDRLLSIAWGHPECDMVAYMSLHTGGLCEQGAGLAGDACHRRVLKKLMRDSSVDNDPRSLSRLLISMPELFQTRLIPLPAVLQHTDLRFSLQTERDLDRAVMILEATGADADYRDLAPLASHFA